MNYGISVLFRFIPLLMALICFFFGGYIFGYGNDEARWVAGPVVFSLGVLCIALFATAATIIRQLIHTYNPVAKYLLNLLTGRRGRVRKWYSRAVTPRARPEFAEGVSKVDAVHVAV